MKNPMKLLLALILLSAGVCSTVPLFSQQRSGQKIPSAVSGRVLYDNGDPLAGATVMVPGTKIGTITIIYTII